MLTQFSVFCGRLRVACSLEYQACLRYSCISLIAYVALIGVTCLPSGMLNYMVEGPKSRKIRGSTGTERMSGISARCISADENM